MKVPRKPPDIIPDQIKSLFSNKSELITSEAKRAEEEGKYRHWDILRHLTPPAGLTREEWWMGIKLRRIAAMKEVPLMDRDSKNCFYYNLPDKILEQLHQFDLVIKGSIDIPEPIINPQTRDQFLNRSLIEEAVTSSQIEGAATTRKVAKEMLRSGRLPRNKSEQMIFNNYRIMEQIRDWKDRPLDENLIFEIHKIVTQDTLDHADGDGRFRTEEELVIVEDIATHEILHNSPFASELPKRLKMMCDFANGKTPTHFIHPIIRAMILHFWLAYDHPFVDGNGRVARALFYWLMIRHGYWLFEFISISQIILKAPAQYGEAFLYTETDQNDLTYFILHQTQVIQKAIQALLNYIERKVKEKDEIEPIARAISLL